ncbi:hypothetical protein GYA44_00390 [Candidatus Microgenomates bacterium]|nr:hypothetical protein [Candidatus Microgenomates bacterium]
MYDNTGTVLGASTAAIVLPATVSAFTGINYFILLGALIALFVVYNIAIKIAAKVIAKRS